MTNAGSASISAAKAEADKASARTDHLSKFWVPFEPAGEGVYFHFGLSSLTRLEENADKLMPGWMLRGFTPFGVYERMLLDGNSSAIRVVLDCGLKRRGEDGKPAPAVDIDLDADQEWSVTDIVRPALEALAFSFFRKTYSELLAEAAAS